ncbi:thiamine pyrophosphate-dependent enzyme [Lactiplantibacillus plantarum]|uniref:thiamine pyrophosphate-dependent enzyme n=1 Tax=Lactiplantibacillus plantarum TaxID=1590 RepID=UPI004045A079
MRQGVGVALVDSYGLTDALMHGLVVRRVEPAIPLFVYVSHSRIEPPPSIAKAFLTQFSQIVKKELPAMTQAILKGTPCPYFSAYYDLSRPGRHFITNRAHGALGFSMSAALGAWVGRPNAKCVSVMGDGSFGFTVGELETIVRHKAPLLVAASVRPG